MENVTLFAVGTMVTRFHRGDVRGFSEVAQANKKFVTLKDGSRWSLGGYSYPRDYSPSSHIAPTTQEHRDRQTLRREQYRAEAITRDLHAFTGTQAVRTMSAAGLAAFNDALEAALAAAQADAEAQRNQVAASLSV